MSLSSQSFVQESLWRPLVHVVPHQRAFLVHPATTISAIQLNPGWHWHWPLLTSIRQVHFEPVTFTFSASQPNRPATTSDEAITAVSLDHHLYTIQGSIELQLDSQAELEILANFNRHSNIRLIRPLIRQFIRQTVAEFDSKTITKDALSAILKESSNNLFKKYGIKIIAISIDDIAQFKPLLTQKP